MTVVADILDKTGIINKETRFIKPPDKTYAVYHRSMHRRGSDERNRITEEDCTIELYAYEKDCESESLIEAELESRGIEYDRQERIWIDEEHLYQTIYEFTVMWKEEKHA